MKCCNCNKDAVISVENVGDFCPDCFNKWTEKAKNYKNDFVYPKELFVMDPYENRQRRFEVYHLNFGRCITWNAIEKPNGYVIEGISYPGDPIGYVIEEFLEKIRNTVQHKTLEPDGCLKMHGNMHITCQNDLNKAIMVIDGKEYSCDEISKLFIRYEGFNIQYKIVERTERPLLTDELLMPVKVGADVLLDELERNIELIRDGYNFISYKDVTLFSVMFDNIYDKLELMIRSAEFKDEGEKAAKRIIKRLENLETDDDFFPLDLIGIVQRIL